MFFFYFCELKYLYINANILNILLSYLKDTYMFAFITFLKDNVNLIATVLCGIGAIIVTIIIGVKQLNKPKRNAILSIKSLQDSQKTINNNKSRLLETIISREITFKRTSIPKVPLKRGQIQLILGEPACGKSYALIKLFNKSNNIIFFDSKTLIDYLDETKDYKKTFISNLNNSHKKYIIIFDGIDELEVEYGSQSLEYLFQFIIEIQSGSKTDSFIISSRNAFYKKNNNFMIAKKYGIEFSVSVVEKWSKDELLSYGEVIIKNTNCKKNLTLLIKKCLNESKTLSKTISNPLDIQMLIYLLTIKDYEEINEITSKFNLYNSFLSSIFVKYCKNPQPGVSASDNYSQFIQNCFDEYLKNNSTNISFSTSISSFPIFKQNGMLIHYSFLEFAVAKHYYDSIKKPLNIKTDLHVFSQEYKNEIEDFITDSINSLDDNEKEEIVIKLMQIYSCTMSSSGKNELKNINEKFINHKMENMVKTLPFKEFFTLKSKTNFRLGRLYFNDKNNYTTIKRILELIYYNDYNVYDIDNPDLTTNIKNDKNYYLALLRRGCAISASFYGFEEIEIDYVKKMLSIEKQFKDYDLANRSHTMLFYGDVQDNKSVFEFKDEDYSISCYNSVNKRIKRLSINLNNEYPKNDVKENKKYYFRLFDLATIYSFARTRDVETLFSDSDKDIIRNCFVDFEKASTDRRELMKNIKGLLIEIL